MEERVCRSKSSLHACEVPGFREIQPRFIVSLKRAWKPKGEGGITCAFFPTQPTVGCCVRPAVSHCRYGIAGDDSVITVENTQLPIAAVIMTHRLEVWARMRKRKSRPGNFFHWGFSILAQTRIIFSIRSGYTLMAEDAVESAGAKAPAITISTRVQDKYLITLFIAHSECSRHPSLRRS